MIDTLNEIEKIVDWYHGIPMDYSGINELIHQRTKLATHYYYFNKQVGDWKIESDSKESQYNELLTDKISYHSSMESMSKAEAMAKSEYSFMIEDVTRNKSMYLKFKGLQNATHEILSAMLQHISILSKERQNIV